MSGEWVLVAVFGLVLGALIGVSAARLTEGGEDRDPLPTVVAERVGIDAAAEWVGIDAPTLRSKAPAVSPGRWVRLSTARDVCGLVTAVRGRQAKVRWVGRSHDTVHNLEYLEPLPGQR